MRTDPDDVGPSRGPTPAELVTYARLLLDQARQPRPRRYDIRPENLDAAARRLAETPGARRFYVLRRSLRAWAEHMRRTER